MSDRSERKGRAIEVEMETSASPEEVWQAWTDPGKISQWFTDSAEGRPEEGTIYTWRFENFGYEIPYTVAEADPPRRFALKFEDESRSGLLEIDIRKRGGRTIVRLVNSGFAEGAEWDEEFEGIDSGWRLALATLRRYLESYFGRDKRGFIAMQPGQFDYASLQPYFHDQARLRQWLTRSGAIGRAAGDPVRLQLRSGESLAGEVLASTPREVEVSWEERGGALALKSFPAGPGRMAAIHFLSWDISESGLENVRAFVEESLQRLIQLLP